ncbi:BACON domain-containing protein [Streptomyces sp. KR80]|uniref:BACON domain-containing protein n=1 Tax=Streptomyces sp. KR80 TaxID=3457426 RepID=UPI003FD38B12
MSRRREHSTHTTGAHKAHHRAPRAMPSPGRSATQGPAGRTDPQSPTACYEPYLDGLFTYCLSVLCEHDAATAALGNALALAERRRARRPADDPLRRPWLYALARWACLQQLAEARRARGTGTGPVDPPLSEAAAIQRRRDLAALAWPEAAGTTPEQREALELAVRHQLSADEIAAVLGMAPDAARALLCSAACEVERTRAALLVVERGRCPVVARLTGDNQVLMGTALRRELVRHVDDCPACRRTAERATAAGPWPGSTTVEPGTLRVLEAPRPAAYAAMERVQRSRSGSARPAPRYDRGGFPLAPKDRVERRRRMRSRAVTTTVVATVLAAPVLALWAAYRGAPVTGEGQSVDSVSAAETEEADDLGGNPYEKAGNAQPGHGPRFRAGDHSPDVSVEVVDVSLDRMWPRDGRGDTTSPTPAGPTKTARPSRPATSPAPGRLTVDAQSRDDATLITLTASGGSPVRWTAHADAPWLQLNLTSGVLRPGESVTITVSVDEAQEPEGEWTARVAVDPAGAVITIHGRGASPEPTPGPSDPEPSPTPTPSDGTASPSPGGSEPPGRTR